MSVPAGSILNYSFYTESTCREFVRAVDENGDEIFLSQTQSNDPNDIFAGLGEDEICSDCDVYRGHFEVDGDHEIEVHFALSGAACTSCGLAMIGLSAMLCVRTRPRRRAGPGGGAAS